MTDYSKIAYSCIFIYITICSFKDLCVQTTNDKHIPITKVGLNTNFGPTIKFTYCYSCGYRKAFDEYHTIIRQKYPEVTVIGGNYEPPSFHLVLARILSFMKMACIVSIFFGINVFDFFNMESPNWYTWCTSNKLYSCLLIFFITNAIEGHLISTGAFEISLNDIPVWSKLETGRIPQPPELFQIIDNHMMLDDPIELRKSGFPK